MPNLILIAGCNGSGKTTTAPALLPNTVGISAFVNADDIARGLNAYRPESSSIEAGRIMLRRVHTLAEQNEDFAFETTLASRNFAPWITSLKSRGYSFHLVFLWLPNDQLAVERVNERVMRGGHSVPRETIKRRYVSGLRNFFTLYRQLANSWQFYDNSNVGSFSLIAAGAGETDISIANPLVWTSLVRSYGCK